MSESIEDYLASLPHGMGGLNDKLGVELVEVTPERIVATMPVEGNTQPYGLLHGGASVVLAETLGACLTQAEQQRAAAPAGGIWRSDGSRWRDIHDQ